MSARIKSIGLAAAVIWLSSLATPLAAQSDDRLDSRSDAQDARNDAVLATPDASTLAPLSNLYATAPGLEQQARTPRWRVNLLAPFGYTSNAESVREGGTATPEASPFGSLSWAAPVADLPLRVTLLANAESDRYFRAPAIDFDKLGVTGRLQYVDVANDQAFSPFIAVTLRWDFRPTFSDQFSSRQDFNVGFNKSFNFVRDLDRAPIGGDTSATSPWSFGLTAFVQRRVRQPQLSSSAVFVIPSAYYVFSRDWNASVAVEFFSRWFDANNVGFSGRIFEAQPIGTIEYIFPAANLGGEMAARRLGRPALDFQASYLMGWSNSPAAGFDEWTASVTLKMAWRF